MMSRPHWVVLFNVLLFLDNQLQGEIYIIIQICRLYKSFAYFASILASSISVFSIIVSAFASFVSAFASAVCVWASSFSFVSS